QVMLDGLEITQFTYFQQCGGVDLDPISAELTYGLERIASFLQDVDSVYDIVWARDGKGQQTKYGEVRLAEEQQFSVYNFEAADVDKTWKHLDLYEAECRELLQNAGEDSRAPILSAFDLCLKCSRLFYILDARAALSVTERVGLIARLRTLAVGVAKAWLAQQEPRAKDPTASGAKAPVAVGAERHG